MKNYKPREGIVSTSICGVYLLIPTRAIYAFCNQVQMLPPQWVIAWKMLQNHEPVENIVKTYEIMTKKPTDYVTEKVCFVLAALCEKGYLEEISSV